MNMAKIIKKFDKFQEGEERECRWCYKKFKPAKKEHVCCCASCNSKYNNYLANDEAQKPWDKFIR